MRLLTAALLSWVVVLFAPAVVPAQAPPRSASHPPLRQAPPPAKRPLAPGPSAYVDPGKGADRNDGSKASPWRTVGHALKQLKAGATLYLRGGTCYENVYLALAGRKDAPITLRSYPGEQAVLDGGLREFFDAPATAWEPYPRGAPGEYRSSKAYPNLRTVIGSFGDSMVGLQTYYHVSDLRSTGERIDWEDWDRRDQTDIKPLYCGPGLWYDSDTGGIHIRLAHTNLPEPVPNYRGQTDPRKLPLVIAPFHSVPLHLDGARHVRIQDLVIRGAGYTAVHLDHAAHVEFDNVTVWCGTYGIRAARTGPLRFVHSGLYGSVAPWTFRTDGSKRDYPGRPHRNISRLNTHALVEIEAGRESSVYATPLNDHWEFAHSHFADAHDGLYLGSINARFHHNLIEDLQDDGLYLSPMYHRHRLEKADPEIHVYQNVFRRMLTALAFGGPEETTRDRVFVYRNVFDLRGNVQTGRPSTKNPKPGFSSGKLIGDHGSPPWSALTLYHNTFVMREAARQASMATFGGTRAGHPRRVFNNIFLHLGQLPNFVAPDPKGNVVADGNLYWSPGVDEKTAAAFFKRYRTSELFAASKKLYPPGSEANGRVADPKFVRALADPASENDYRLQPGSAAVDGGVELPADWPDPLRKADRGRPDVGALPLGTEAPRVGRRAAAP
ncbi:MAG: hypothetical protein L0Z62_14150 [Gemmataceae bacterium]|nr:hypothetical protein [Gemmataceae bacterium]